MRVRVDRELCQGHGMCEDAAPEVFRVVESAEGTYSHVEIVAPEPEASLRRKVEEAVRFCPTRALAIEEAQ
ncbi:MAG: ferredoxin [Myxococcota bacterium]|nr:ferredoxin [Myxococcota bacterium]